MSINYPLITPHLGLQGLDQLWSCGALGDKMPITKTTTTTLSATYMLNGDHGSEMNLSAEISSDGSCAHLDDTDFLTQEDVSILIEFYSEVLKEMMDRKGKTFTKSERDS